MFGLFCRNDTLLVVNQAHFTVLVSLDNPGDDSFNTSIVLHYPEGLSLSKFDTVKVQLSTRQTKDCQELNKPSENGFGIKIKISTEIYLYISLKQPQNTYKSGHAL